MQFSKLCQFSFVSLGFSAPTFACVQFSLNIQYTNGNQLMNAGLTDGGVQYCSITNEYVNTGSIPDYELGCVGGFYANFDYPSGDVTYEHPDFSGVFGTTQTNYYDPFGDLIQTYWTANPYC